MGARRALLATLSLAAALGLAACGSASSSSTTTTTTVTKSGGSSTTAAGGTSGTGGPSSTGAAPSTTSPAAAHGLCADITTFSKQQQGLSAAGGGSLSALRTYARQAKTEFDHIAPAIAQDLATAPANVQSAWASVVPQIDQLFQSAVTTPSAAAFQQNGTAIESSPGFMAANQTLNTYAGVACPTAQS